MNYVTNNRTHRSSLVNEAYSVGCRGNYDHGYPYMPTCIYVY